MCGIIEQLDAGARASRTSIASRRRTRSNLPPVVAFPAWLRSLLLLTLFALRECPEPLTLSGPQRGQSQAAFRLCQQRF
jgi:hypothetical protein